MLVDARGGPVTGEASWQLAARAPDLLAENERLMEALQLARNRLQLASINATASGDSTAPEYSEWADEANAALSPNQESKSPLSCPNCGPGEPDCMGEVG